jgi:hypothetical protein
MLSGEVNMWRNIVIGKIAKNTMNVKTWATHQPWCHVVSVDALEPLTS